MDNIIKRFKNLMYSLSLEYIAEEADTMSLKDMVKECKYWLDCYNEPGNTLYDMRYEDNYSRKKWTNDTNRLKRFIKKYEEVK